MKIAMLLPDGVGIRNFLLTKFVDRALESGELMIWHGLHPDTIKEYRQRWGDAVRWIALPSRRENTAARILRQAKIHAQLYWTREPILAPPKRRGKSPGELYHRAVQKAAQTIGRLSAGPRRLQLLEQAHRAVAGTTSQLAPYLDILREHQPDVVFCTHQRAGVAVPAMLAARKLRIPAATFIYSWDNLPKGRMAVYADRFLVWSGHMKNEMLRYYPEVRADRVSITGTPQFEHYFNQSLLEDRAVFLAKLGLDPARPVVCFSGDDIASSPYDPTYLADLAQSLRSIPADQRPQIVFRNSPADVSDRYSKVLRDYPEIAVSRPRWLTPTGDWTQLTPLRGDLALLMNLARHCDLVVNLGSTMALDFAIFDKPAIYLAYEPEGTSPANNWTAEEIYRLPHFKIVHELQPIYWARQSSQLADLVLHALGNPAEKASARATWLAAISAQPLEGASDRFFAALQTIAAQSPVKQQNAGRTSPAGSYSK